MLLHFTGFGRLTYVIGNSKDVARFSGVRVARHRISIFVMSGTVAALAGILYTARLGSARASTATGFELDIITVVLLGGVSIFGGSGSMLGVVLSTFLVLNLRNGMSLAGVNGNTQTGIVGLLLILSVLLPNIVGDVQDRRRRRNAARAAPGAPAAPASGRRRPPGTCRLRSSRGTTSGADRYHAAAFDEQRWATTPRIGEVEEES